MSQTDRLVENARRYEAPSTESGRPASGVAVVACMDARLNPYGLLGLAEGDAHLIRNAGGVVTAETRRSLAISQHLLGTSEIMLIHHTDCGLLGLDGEAFTARLEAETGARPDWSVEAFDDLDDHVRESIAQIRTDPFIPHTKAVRGFVYDVKTGRMREVMQPAE